MKKLLSHLVITCTVYKEKNLKKFSCNSWTFQTTYLSFELTGRKKVRSSLQTGWDWKNQTSEHFSTGLHKISQTLHVAWILKSLFDIFFLKNNWFIHRWGCMEISDPSFPRRSFPRRSLLRRFFAASLFPARSFPRPYFVHLFLINKEINWWQQIEKKVFF